MKQKVTFAALLEAAQERRELARKMVKSGKSKAEVGKLLGVSRQRVHQLVSE